MPFIISYAFLIFKIKVTLALSKNLNDSEYNPDLIPTYSLLEPGKHDTTHNDAASHQALHVFTPVKIR